LIYKTSPEDLRLILIDPKQIEFAPYEHVPHLYMPIVTDMQRAAGALACAVQEMERRFSLIKDVGVRNIEAYNEAVRNDPDREHLPYIIIVIDEFADLKMSCNNNDPENFTCRIAQKARAAGIHLIIGTQRPSVDVITGKLKTNIPSRIAFMVKQQVDSRTILDANGAESLTGRGDMLYMPTNSNDKQPVRIQGAFVSDGELERVVSFVKSHNPPVQYNRSFMDQIEAEMARAAKSDRKGDDFDYDDEDEGGEDPKFFEAVELAVQTQKVATSLLQRRLGVGYGRAAKIIDRMEELGLVSAAEGNKPRKLLPAAQGYLDHMGAGGDGDPSDDFEDDYS
jgi:S-DNA-T family DNA segregation ATPase FtsK/SpoIIIE